MPLVRTGSGVATALALGATCAAVSDVGPAQAAAHQLAPVTQRLAVLTSSHAAFTRPDHRSKRLERVGKLRPLTGARTALPILGQRKGADGRTWLHVMLPGRPNSHTGWISRSGTRAARTPWRLHIDTSQRRVTVIDSGYARRSFRIVVGSAVTPTPHGRFFVEESLRLTPDRVGAPFALALSARSNVLQQFDGGPGQIALHGLGNVGGTPGTAASHGCLRMTRSSISWLAARIGPGVPVTITR